MIVSVHQPQFMPWLGYFEKISQADHFVLLDTVQYKKNEWQNRNRIKTPNGWQWLTVPVSYKFPQKIFEVGVANKHNWQSAHQKGLQANYAKAPFYSEIMPFFERLFANKWDHLLALNVFIIQQLAKILGITTPIHLASELGNFPDAPDERLIEITRHLGGTTYLAGAGGKAYMDAEKWSKSGIEVRHQEYVHPVYPQLFGPFEYYMATLDLIFNCGPRSLSILTGNQK